MNPPPVYLRAPAIAARLGVSVRTVRRWIDAKILPSIKIGGARLVAMARRSPGTVPADPETLRELVNGIRPALHDVSDKTWANLRSLLVAALELAGAIDPMGRGDALADPAWSR